MKLITTVCLSLMTCVAFAKPSDVTLFQCKTTKVVEGKKPTLFSFYVENLNTKAKVSYWSANDSEQDPVTMVPADSALMLNDNYLIKRTEKGLELSSDGDGCQFTRAVLYTNTNYKHGHVAVEDGGCGATPFYTTVTCKTSVMK